MATSSNVSTHSFRSAVSEAASTPTSASYHEATSNWDQESSQRSTASRRSSASADTLRPAANNQHESDETNSSSFEPIRTPGERTVPQPPQEPQRTNPPSSGPEILAEKPSSVRTHSPTSSTTSRQDYAVTNAPKKIQESSTTTTQHHNSQTQITPAQPPSSSNSPPQSKGSQDEEKYEAEENSRSTTTSPQPLQRPSPIPLNELSPYPPPINYSLRPRVFAIIVFWSLILFDSIAIPITLYFCLTRLTHLSRNAVFSISTGALGGISIVEYFLRFWRLFRRSSTCRVLNGRRWYLDWFHWNFSIAWLYIMVELVVGTAFKHPPIRLLAMPVSTMLFWFAVQLLLQDSLRLARFHTPVRISSVPRGAPMRPGIYSIIEDVVAVDGSGHTRFREELDARFLASRDFRSMLHRLSVFWGIGSGAAATLTTILVFALDKEPAYVVGWTLPFVWAGIWALATWWYVHVSLKREHRQWGATGRRTWSNIGKVAKKRGKLLTRMVTEEV